MTCQLWEISLSIKLRPLSFPSSPTPLPHTKSHVRNPSDSQKQSWPPLSLTSQVPAGSSPSQRAWRHSSPALQHGDYQQCTDCARSCCRGAGLVQARGHFPVLPTLLFPLPADHLVKSFANIFTRLCLVVSSQQCLLQSKS
jgi:hypothetical protein